MVIQVYDSFEDQWGAETLKSVPKVTTDSRLDFVSSLKREH